MGMDSDQRVQSHDGTNPTDAVGGDARNDGTQENFTETRLKDALKLAYEQCGSAFNHHDWTVSNGFQPSPVEHHPRKWLPSQRRPMKCKRRSSVYIEDFGTYKSVVNRFQRDRDVYIVNPDYAKVAYLRPLRQKELSVAGDAEKRQITVEFGLQWITKKLTL